MAEDGQLARFSAQASGEPTLADLLDPVALEARLREARVRRAEALARRNAPEAAMPAVPTEVPAPAPPLRSPEARCCASRAACRPGSGRLLGAAAAEGRRRPLGPRLLRRSRPRRRRRRRDRPCAAAVAPATAGAGTHRAGSRRPRSGCARRGPRPGRCAAGDAGARGRAPARRSRGLAGARPRAGAGRGRRRARPARACRRHGGGELRRARRLPPSRSPLLRSCRAGSSSTIRARQRPSPPSCGRLSGPPASARSKSCLSATRSAGRTSATITTPTPRPRARFPGSSRRPWRTRPRPRRATSPTTPPRQRPAASNLARRNASRRRRPRGPAAG